MSPAAPIDPTLLESSHSSTAGLNRRFGDLRGLRWRIGLGILPLNSSIDDLRRVTADSRRRYASLRRGLLVDPHLPKDGSSSPDLDVDNPLSHNPDSMWGRFFRNAELERIVEQDLSRLYPEHGSYFPTMGYQSTLRRILLLWCLQHPECGYRQGMHELVAPLLYVLHADVEHLLHVRKLYEDYFVDKFDGFPFEDSDLLYNFDFKKFSESRKGEIDSEKCPSNCSSVSELDSEVQDIVFLSDAYGTEGELGVLISYKFMEHDAYCMFDALMSGAGGEASMAKFFSPSPLVNSHTGLSPVIEASSALYHLLSIVDSSIHSHLVELGVEPQYFALRWLRVLFGREFSLEDLIIIWDEIFSCDNGRVNKCADDSGLSFAVLSSPRGAFISAFAVSIILSMRSSLLATENATSCLQRLLNFPGNKDLKKILTKAKSLQALALDANNSTPLPLHNVIYRRDRHIATRGKSITSKSVSPKTPLNIVPKSYWEEKWRDLHKAEELRQNNLKKDVSHQARGWYEKVRLQISRTKSTSSSSKDPELSVRGSLLEDLSRQLGLEEDIGKTESIKALGEKIMVQGEIEENIENNNDDTSKYMYLFDEDRNLCCSDEETGSGGCVCSRENISSFSELVDDNHNGIHLGIGRVASNLSFVKSDGESDNTESCGIPVEESSLPVSDSPEEVCSNAGLDTEPEDKGAELTSPKYNSMKSGQNEGSFEQPQSGVKDGENLSGKFQWFWRSSRNNAGEGTSEKGVPKSMKAFNGAIDHSNDKPNSSALNGSYNFQFSIGETLDQNVMVSLRNLGQSMLDNIQVIESVYQQERPQVRSLDNLSKSVLVGKGQVTTMSALKELRKVSSLLSEL